jgi:hypothetical protein
MHGHMNIKNCLLFLPRHWKKTNGLVNKVKLKQSHYRPGKTPRDPRGRGSQIPWNLAHENDNAVNSRPSGL